jgi:type II secretory pathway component PulF
MTIMQFRWPGLNPFGRLSAEEATEFAARVAELTKAGLPLGAGLQALADELPGRRLPRMLRDVARRLDAGDDLLAVLESQGARLPAHLRGLMLAGMRTGRLAEVLEEYVDLQYGQAELRRRVAAALAYPFLLLLFLTALSAFAGLYIVDEFAKIFRDFGTQLPFMTEVIIWEARPIMWFFVALSGLATIIPLLLWIAPAAGWLWPVVYRLPMVGPLLRWSHLAQFARLMGLLLEQQVPLPDALRVTAVGLQNGNLARGCRRAAEDTERGRPLDESLAARRQFPASLIPVIQWGQRAAAVPDAFRAAAEMFDGRSRAQGTLLETMALPIMFLAIVICVGVFVTAMFLPLIQLIQRLS